MSDEKIQPRVIAPGLTLLRGGEGRGKTRLLRQLAAEQPIDCFFEHPADAAFDAVVARAWLARLQPRFAANWQPAVAAALIKGFGLAEHIDKPLFMLSAGSRRKVGLVAAAASGATLTLLDTPYAALDARSGRVLNALLIEAAESTERAWVVADYALPAGLAGVRLAALIDLGD